MTTAYFLTGSFNDRDNDFELTISIQGKDTKTSALDYGIMLRDLSDGGKPLWENAGQDFTACLEKMEGFLSDNFITLYSKILTSAHRDPLVDKELEGFIINHLE